MTAHGKPSGPAPMEGLRGSLPPSAGHPVVLFDGACNLCHGAVVFVSERDKRGLFRFAALDSPEAQKLVEQPVPSNPSTLLLWEGGRTYSQSTAALRIARKLDGAWPILFYLGVLVPRALRDVVYRFIARNRIQWFGRRPTCPIP